MTRPHDRLDPYQLRETHWPLLKRDPELTESAAVMIAELVRYLNHATNTDAAVPYAGSLYRLTGNLASAAHGLHQLCRQLACRADELAGDPSIRHDHFSAQPADQARREAGSHLVAAADALDGEQASAAAFADLLGDRLTAAQGRVTWISHNLDDPDDDATEGGQG